MFMDYFLFVATVSLVFQLAVIALILVGFELKRKTKFRLHGFTMLSALAVHLVIIFVVMVPSFVLGAIPLILENPVSEIGLLIPVHVAAGLVTAALGVWIMFGWRLRKSTEFCAPRRRFMRVTFIAWLVSLSFGVLVYLVFYWTFLFG